MGLAASIAASMLLLGACILSHGGGARESWLYAMLLAELVVAAAVSVRLSPSPTPCMSWLASRLPSRRGRQGAALPAPPNRFWEGYMVQLSLLSVVVDSIAGRSSAWEVSSGVVSSVAIAGVGFGVSLCNDLFASIAVSQPPPPDNPGIASPGDVVERPPAGHGEVAKAVAMVNARSRYASVPARPDSRRPQPASRRPQPDSRRQKAPRA